MEHRELPGDLHMSDMNQDRSQSHPTDGQAHIYMGSNASSNGTLIHERDNTSANEPYGSFRNTFESWSSAHSSANLRPENSQVCSSHSVVTSYDAFSHPASGSFYRAPENNNGNSHYGRYKLPMIPEVESGQLGNERGAFKRKRPRFNGSSSSRFCTAESSSSSFELQTEKPISGHRSYSSGSSGETYYRGGNLSIGSEYSRRVRSRSRLDSPVNSRLTYPSSSSHNHHIPMPPYNCHPTAHRSNHCRSMDSHNLSSYDQNRTGTLQTPASLPSTHEVNQYYVRGSTDNDGSYRDASSSRSHISTQRYHHNFNAQAREGHCDTSRRSVPLNWGPSSSRWRHHDTISLENSVQAYPQNASIYSRPLSAGSWRHTYRDTRSRVGAERFQSLSLAGDVHNGIGSQGLVVDRSYLYSSRNVSDQYRDMRLDIDDMGYEELLALGDTIGSVNTGLSEDVMIKCLMETTYSFDNNPEETSSCAICLEEYEKGERIGTVNNCGHDYHASCIKKWLCMKNACPICKTPALFEDPKKGVIGI